MADPIVAALVGSTRRTRGRRVTITSTKTNQFLTIRDLAIDDPFYTYCGNHPHRRPMRDPVPIGPVLIGHSTGAREIWKPSPDNEDIRRHLLKLLSEMKEKPRSEYPLGIYTDEVVVMQLGEFREARAVENG